MEELFDKKKIVEADGGDNKREIGDEKCFQMDIS